MVRCRLARFSVFQLLANETRLFDIVQSLNLGAWPRLLLSGVQACVKLCDSVIVLRVRLLTNCSILKE